jgi:hypothetical protein
MIVRTVRAVGCTAIASALLGGLWMTHCTSARDPLHSRIEALEKRVAELENASPPAAAVEDAAAGPDVDASVEARSRVAANKAPSPTSPAWLLSPWADGGSCEDHALRGCADRFTSVTAPPRGSSRHAQGIDGGPFVWHRQLDLDSPEGQGCLRQERERCESDIRFNEEQRALHDKQQQDYFRWLDRHLLPDRIDAKLSAQVETRTVDALRQAGEAKPKVKVRCVLEFCRVDLDVDPVRQDLRAAGYKGIDWQGSGSNAREDPANPRRYSIYVARPGWAMPSPASLMQRGPSTWFWKGRSRDGG